MKYRQIKQQPSPYAFPGMRGVVARSVTREMDIDRLFEMVCDIYQVTRKQLVDKTRQRNIAEARQILMFLLMEDTKIGCVEVGRMFNRDHTTVLYARKAVNDWMTSNLDYARFIGDLRGERGVGAREMVVEATIKEPETEKMVIVRPPTKYSNSGYFRTVEKYAI